MGEMITSNTKGIEARMAFVQHLIDDVETLIDDVQILIDDVRTLIDYV